MRSKYILLVIPFLLSSILLAGQSDEKFDLSCKASHSESEENLQADAVLTITERPSTGAALTFNYELLNLPYQAKVKIYFGENLIEDTWTLFFVDMDNSAKFSWTKATIGSSKNEISIKSRTPDGSAELTFLCSIERLQ